MKRLIGRKNGGAARRNGTGSRPNYNAVNPRRPQPQNVVEKVWNAAGRVIIPFANAAITHLTGVDFLSLLQVAGATPTRAAGTILVDVPLTPDEFAGTRMKQLSEMYARYRFKALNLRYVPSVPTAMGCQLVMYVDPDPKADLTTLTADERIRVATTAQGSKQFNFINRTSVPLISRADDQFYYTGDNGENVRFEAQGRLYVIQVTDPVDFANGPIETDFDSGSLYLDWHMVCSNPRLQPNFDAPRLPPGYEYQSWVAFLENTIVENGTVFDVQTIAPIPTGTILFTKSIIGHEKQWDTTAPPPLTESTYLSSPTTTLGSFAQMQITLRKGQSSIAGSFTLSNTTLGWQVNPYGGSETNAYDQTQDYPISFLNTKNILEGGVIPEYAVTDTEYNNLVVVLRAPAATDAVTVKGIITLHGLVPKVSKRRSYIKSSSPQGVSILRNLAEKSQRATTYRRNHTTSLAAGSHPVGPCGGPTGQGLIRAACDANSALLSVRRSEPPL